MSETLYEIPGRPAAANHRVLVVANEQCGPEVCDLVAAHAADGESEVFVITPALTRGRLEYWATDFDKAEAQAERKLQQAFGCLRARGLPVRGHIGDPNPLQAIEDALHEFPADEIIIAAHPKDRSNWLETHLVDRAHRFGLPITPLIVDRL